MAYNWQLNNWPNFRYRLDTVEDELYAFAEQVGRISGLLDGLSETARTETMIDFMVAEAIKTSEIEGEYLSRQDVMSSIRNNLGLPKQPETVKDKRAEGAAQLMINVRKDFDQPLSAKMLQQWHTILMQDAPNIQIGAWRTHIEPMQVISGPIGKEKIHFEAPPSRRVPDEMTRFIQWFNDTKPGGSKEITKPAIRSAIAHLYFETIHPFEDGNGRIGRAIAEKALSQGIGRPVLLSLSQAIERRKNEYYDALKQGQRSNEITEWIEYFVKIVLQAQSDAEDQIDFTLKKARFFDSYKDKLNERQLRIVKRMLEEGPEGFKGGMSAQKYIRITGVSKATATRDLQDLANKGAFVVIGGGRSTRYDVNLGIKKTLSSAGKKER